jgi:ribosomal protein S18 acetylase RimI-like enzyme
VVKDFVFTQASSQAEIAQARELFLEYAQSLNFSLCFQNFDQELAELPGHYAPPDGRLILVNYEGELAGCVALHKLEPMICEMKRLYVRPKFRGKGVGRALVDRVIAEAREAGYRRMRLDTVEPSMKDAVAMYRKMGFREIAPYCSNPMPGALYMELNFDHKPKILLKLLLIFFAVDLAGMAFTKSRGWVSGLVIDFFLGILVFGQYLRAGEKL